jgi:hypothetical protein
VEVARVAIDFGIKILWGFEGIAEIKEAYQVVYQTGNQDFMRWFENAGFDFKTSQVRRYHPSFPKEIISQCKGLAEILGLPASCIYQLGILAGLFTSERINIEDNHKIYEILMEFQNWVKMRSVNAREIQAMCVRKQPLPSRQGTRKTLADLVNSE